MSVFTQPTCIRIEILDKKKKKAYPKYYNIFSKRNNSYQSQLFKTCDILIMKLSYLTFGLALLAISILSLAPDIPSSSIASYPVLVINVYHPKCIRCKNAVAQIHKLHEEANPGYQVAQINCAKQESFCDQLKTSYPSVFLYVEGHQIIYEGRITAKDLSAYMRYLFNPDLPKLTQKDLEEKEGKQAFMLVGGLNQTERIQIAATKSARYIGIEFYELQTTDKVFSLHVTDQEKKIDLTFPLNTRLFAYQVFHRTRDHVMPASKPQYLNYFRKQEDSDQVLIIYDHHDQLSSDSAQALDKICYELVLDVLCFRVEKQSQAYQDFVGHFVPFPDRTSIILSKKAKQKGYIYRSDKFNEKQFREFLKDAKGNKRDADFDYIKESKERMKSQNVLNIDDEAHQQIIKNNSIVFVQYYSPFFKNCSDFVSQYDTVGQHFKSLGSSIVIASIDGDQQLALIDEQKVKIFPAFKVFINGQGFHYEGEKTAEGIINYLTQITRAKLLVVPHLKDVRKPAVAISGITENSTLHILPVFFNSIPIYWVTEDKDFKVVLLKQNDEIQTFSEQNSFGSVLDWLQVQAGPVLVSLGDSNVPKKLQAALNKGLPILGLINKGSSGPVDSQIQVLASYCQNKKDIVCGVVSKGEDDYEQLLKWINDNDSQTNRLVWIDHRQFKSYLSLGDLVGLSESKIEEFINGVKSGAIAEQRRAKTQEELDQEESEQETEENNTQPQQENQKSNEQL